jgi:energy-coupling factor transport system ATP-binding protein
MDSPEVMAWDVWFRYEKDAPDVLRGMGFEAYAGELLCIVGGNGTGKTTALGVLSGIHRPYRGKTRVAGVDPARAGCAKVFEAGLTVLPQDPQTLFTRKTIAEDLLEAVTGEGRDEAVREVAEKVEIEDILSMHPYDVSGGEQQRAALARVLLTKPRILLMDEPTKGMDSFFKRKFADILRKLLADGMACVMVSHDIEFCAAYADRCALFFDGGVVTQGEPERFFSGNSFYTTAANRMSRGLLADVVTAEDVIEKCKERTSALTGDAAAKAEEPATAAAAAAPAEEPTAPEGQNSQNGR